MTAAEVRAKYPNPAMADRSEQKLGAYCVGGAACTFATGTSWHFPYYTTVADILEITCEQARKIIAANDFGEFDRAWQLLDEALKGAK